MRLASTTIAIALLTPQMAIAAGILNLPIPSRPCTTVSTPHGDMCAPKLTQSLKVYGTIRTQREDDAQRICHGWAGQGYKLLPTGLKEWLCVKYE